MVRELKDIIEGEAFIPAVVFLEGVDLILDDAMKMNLVVPLMHELQRLARHYHIAVVLSVGAPKMKAKDKYTLHRDMLFGSVAWGRMAETVIVLQFPNGDDASDQRRMTVLLRNGPSESFDLVFKDGILEEVPKGIPQIGKGDFNRWVLSQPDWFSIQQAMLGTGLSRNTVSKRLNALAIGGLLDPKKAEGKNKNLYRVKKNNAGIEHNDNNIFEQASGSGEAVEVCFTECNPTTKSDVGEMAGYVN